MLRKWKGKKSNNGTDTAKGGRRSAPRDKSKKDLVCFKCGTKRHYSKNCWSKGSENESQVAFTSNVETRNNRTEKFG
jgi:hypothetical protein